MSSSDQGRPIVDRIRTARRRLAMGELLSGVLFIVAMASMAWLLAVSAESAFRLPTTGRLILIVVVGVLVLAGTLRFVVSPVLRWLGLLPGLSNDAVAQRIGRVFPEVKDRLQNLLQLMDGRHSAAPEPLVVQARESLGQSLEGVPIERVETFAGVRRAGRLASLPMAIILAFLLLGREPFLEASSRLLAPGTDFAPPLTYSVAVSPESISVVKGQNVDVEAVFSGTGIPHEARIEFVFAGENAQQSALMSQPPVSGHSFVNLRQSLRYRVVAGALSTAWFDIQVVDQPVISRLQVTLAFPRYTRVPPRQLPENDGTVTALRGTRVQIDAVMAGPAVREAAAVLESGLRVPLDVSGRSWRGSFVVTGDDTWRIEALSEEGIPNANPIEYRLRATEDAAPTISFLAPEPSVDLDEAATVDLAWRATDDYGFSNLTLNFRLDESRFGQPSESFQVLPLELSSPWELDQAGGFSWRLAADTGLDPVPGDVFSYFLEIADNNSVSGPSRARTPIYRLRMPSLTERYQALDSMEDRAEDSMEEVSEQARRVREQFEELRDELRSKTEAEWQDERALEQLMKEQQSLEESVSQIADQLEEMTQEMSQNQLVSEETLDLFEELRQVAEEVNTPEMMEALQNLQQAMEEMNLQQMQEALEKFEFSEKMYQQRMERTLELFKNLRVQQDLEEAARRAEELAKTEENLAERTEPLAEQPEARPEEETRQEAEKLSQEQERAAQEMEQLQEKLDKIAERMEELKNAPDEEMDELADDLRREDMPEQMRDNAKQMKQQDFQKAQQQQKKMSESLQSLQQNLQEMQQGMQGGQMQMNMAGLRRALDDVLGLSNDQESLRNEVQRLASDSPQLRETAQRQLRLSEGASLVSDSLQALAKSIPQMSRQVQVHAGEALREMADATQAMSDRVGLRAAGFQKGAMTHLNELALMLADLLDQMMNGQGSGGSMSMEQFMQQLQDMAGQQQQLNQQVQQLLNDMQGNRLTQDMQERVRQLSGQQEQIRRDLRQLSRERSLRNNALGDLEQIAEQMQETIEELQQQRMSRRTVQRQQQILTRLLEASRSMQERGRERKRESRSADQLLRTSPADLTPSEQAERLRRDLIRALESGYAPDYEELIRRYFELLGSQGSDGGRGN